VNPIHQEFILDLERLRNILRLVQLLVSFPSCSEPQEHYASEDFCGVAYKVYEATKNSHAHMPILTGTLLLYLAGRFENFVKEIFEDLCDSLASECKDFAHLPKPMQENLVKFTAEVIANPRKFGHAENGVIAFVNTLTDNLNRRPLNGVNSKCLSITTENMWPDTLSDMFARIGAKNIWNRLGQQACVQIFFQSEDPSKASSEARTLLTAFMEWRNKIAHPSGTLTWPSIEQVGKYIDFCEILARALSEVGGVYAVTLPTRPSNAQQGAAGDAQ
jgi:hypothetical protein